MIVHMGWIGSPIPPHIAAAVNAVRAAAHDCEVMFHEGDEIIPEPIRSQTATLIPHMRSDIQRHAALKRYGGLWLDADVRLLTSPTTWAAAWDRYTVVRFGQLTATDIIYVPDSWDGWPTIDAYMERTIAEITATRRVKLLAMAMRMVETCQREMPEVFSVVDCPSRFPSRPEDFTTESVVARAFDPAVVPARPVRPGLGDLVKAGLSAVGITEERVSKAIGRPCGCSKRAAKLNQLGTYLGLPPGSTAGS